MGVPPAQKGRAGRPSHNKQEKWILFNSHSYVVKRGITIKTTTKEGIEQGRVLDVSVIDRTLWRAERQAYAALESPIQLAVEVVSTNWEDDYVDKLDEYERLGIAE